MNCEHVAYIWDHLAFSIVKKTITLCVYPVIPSLAANITNLHLLIYSWPVQAEIKSHSNLGNPCPKWIWLWASESRTRTTTRQCVPRGTALVVRLIESLRAFVRIIYSSGTGRPQAVRPHSIGYQPYWLRPPLFDRKVTR